MYKRFIRPLLWCVSPEAGHVLAIQLLRIAGAIPFVPRAVRGLLHPADPSLRVRALGLELSNPIGLAAGFDKEAAAYRGLNALGFGHVEVGTITAQPQEGNPKPRLFRLPDDRALINRMGFNNCGAEKARERLLRKGNVIVGVNIGKTRVTPNDDEAIRADYVKSAELLAERADYLVVNVSSPNTPGLRDLEEVERLRPLISAVQEASRRASPRRKVPVLVKISPDLASEDVARVAEMALEVGLDGIIATNTTISRDALVSSRETVMAAGAGGFSGPPLKARSLEILRQLYRQVGNRLVLVSCGGIETVDDVWDRICAGATLVQIYTAFVYDGPALPGRLARGLARLVKKHGLENVQQAVGRDSTAG